LRPIREPRPAAPARRSRVGRYALWQLRDYLLDRGFPTLLICVLFGYIGASSIPALLERRLADIPAGMIVRYGSVDAARQAIVHDTSASFLHGFLGAVVFLAALLATNGIVANDRKQGFYRFLFAKPLSPARYYGQVFLVHWAGFLLVFTLLALLYGYFITPVLTGTFLLGLGLMYLSYAGIAFALSAAARWDWLSLVSVAVAASYLWDRFGESTSAFAPLLYLLPPLHRTDAVYGAIANGVALPWHSLGWLAGYGAVCYLLGLVILHHRRLAII
jgi:hypothetical protein